MNKHAMNWQS